MTDEQIIAYVDGELGPLEALRFERAMEADPEIAARVDRHRRLRKIVATHFGPVADEPLPGRLTELFGQTDGADRRPDARGDNVVAFPAKPRRRFAEGGRYAALAATLVAGLVLGQFLPRGSGAPLGDREGVVVAQGTLAYALDHQLTSTPATNARYRIGTSFRSADRRYCRTFASNGAGGAGIGCRDAEGWTVERFIAGGAAGEAGVYRQAASPSAEIAAAAQEMMTGAPLDAVQERAVQAKGWLAGPQ